ncbi:MAG: class IV adenylate cyclase [Candidatus Eisenbacteria sp.]|nr:class IV adenylate cyclase [Candidatus Eisenbacteria bacterium]
MGSNIEIKARIEDLEGLKERVCRLSDGPAQRIVQEDTFFHSKRGRLKLRILAPDRGELIYYERDDGHGPQRSTYIISPTAEPDSLRAILSASHGIRGVVRKTRLLYMAGNTRIHLDEVDGLGAFLELEVVLGSGQSSEEGEALASELMRNLEIEPSALIDVAYIDLLEESGIGPHALGG